MFEALSNREDLRKEGRTGKYQEHLIQNAMPEDRRYVAAEAGLDTSHL